MNLRLFCATCFLVVGPVGLSVAADPIYPGADTVEYKDPSGWTFTVAAYGWLAGLEGDVGSGGGTAHIDASIGETSCRISTLG
jgi:hypothetical protein